MSWLLTRERTTKMNAIRKHQKPMSSGLTWDNRPLSNGFWKPQNKIAIIGKIDDKNNPKNPPAWR